MLDYINFKIKEEIKLRDKIAMLVNLTPIQAEIERRYAVAKEHNFEYIPQSDPAYLQETGIYQSTFPFNFPEDEFEEINGHSRYETFVNMEKSTYGVADTIDQIKDYYKEEIADTNNRYAIALTPVWQDKANEGKGGGWRWHKWGPYIGSLNPQYEYLDDEDFGDDFKYIIVFTLYKVN